ncbi:MAG TPA: cellulase family glycosylhydrolase, partial [Burkholderiaceae bacterium]
MLRERVAWLGAAPRVPVDSYATPAITLQNTPVRPPVAVSSASFTFGNFGGANVIGESYIQAGNHHRLWIPGASQMATLAARATALNLKYLRMPVIIPPDAAGSEYVASEWYAPAGAANANQINVSTVVNATQTALNIAHSYGLKVILVLDGYTEYDTACNAMLQPLGLKLWKKSFDAVQGNARQIVTALSSNDALFAWDLMNEPLWNASAYGCLDTAPSNYDRGTQKPLLNLPAGASAQVQSYTEVVEAVHAMYNLVRANDAFNHPTTVGEGKAPFLHYWNDISSFASPHIYFSPQRLIDAQVYANQGQPPALQVGQFGGAPSSGKQWHVGDQLIQTLLPGMLNAAVASMQGEIAGLPLIVGEFGASYPHDVINPAEQGNYFSLTLLSPAGSLQSLNLGNMLWDISEGNQGGTDFSAVDSTGKLLPAACVVAKARGTRPTGC